IVRILCSIEGRDVWLHDDGHLSWLAKAAIDSDGCNPNGTPNNVYGDPYYQPATSLKHSDGTYLNALTESYIVVPPAVINGVGPIVLGCQARVHYRNTSELTYAVVGDVGPHQKLGELSIRCAQRLKIPFDPNNGGEDNPDMVLFEIWPGKPAVVDNVTYPLQKS